MVPGVVSDRRLPVPLEFHVLLLRTDPNRRLRLRGGHGCDIDANLGIANMDFHKFAGDVDSEGVFRGF
jgi:hypothetical protein